VSGKRDDDSASDMDVGMTTAERRRRRRRGGGLRVPSDNVPRRSNPPVVAPVPEDPSLAMSIAYSFTSDSSDPVQRVDLQNGPKFADPVAPEMMPTVIDPPSAPVEQADFEMKTREMTAVDLEELGLSSESGANLHLSLTSTNPSLPGVDVTVRQPRAERLSDRHVRADSTDRAIELDVDVDVETASDSQPIPKEVVDGDSKRSTPMPVRTIMERPKTVALTDDDLEEVREAVRAATVPSNSPSSPAIKPPGGATVIHAKPPRTTIPPMSTPGITTPPPAAPTVPRTPTPSVPPANTSSNPGIAPVRQTQPLRTANPTPPPPPMSTTMPPPVAPKPPRELDLSNRTQELSALDIEAIDKSSPSDREREAQSVPEIDINELSERAAESSGDIEVTIEEGEARDAKPAEEPRRSRPPSTPPPIAPSAQQTQPGVPPPVPANADKKAPPAPPPAKKDGKPEPAAAVVAKAAPTTPVVGKGDKPSRGKPWFVDLFDEDYLRTLPFLTPQATQAEAEFVIDAMSLQPGAQVLDLGCGYGRHAMELAARGYHVVGLDLSTPLLIRGGEEAQRRGLQINFVRGDMRELDFEAQFDGAYCLFSTFGYFDDETNKKTVANIARALKPGGRVLIEILNRDYVIADLPTRVWWEGDGCVVLEEVELNYFSSRIQVNRSVVFDDGRQLEQEISVRAYSLHEVGKLMHAAGFRVLEVSGGYHTRSRFFGNQSRHIIVLAERKEAT
jgi:SAM-dependent methyltransferase